MIQELVIQWEENKHKLEEYFRTTKIAIHFLKQINLKTK